ncbi:methylmalonyl Co-A mutase-associated GTPase MeaB [Solitalea canadensis]|uniref:LAO/AO transport system ATPase n=1 Tax=Solitalea canadensis (strain ATCC 29591 / DSM 3403 / JCM 21819 / LMG 8368 / NBRC 15130 / NCIMB 12057 / USAM 9D) TaxID=929556 RepID=H8KWG6_SOLCM|nr:methylmalonyl Co-A mutase-associated GTPase MeaB [Solitalea canadensis]AFD08084.1 LAO/AO transport system ATPase [Solitalea canadensis DSM 3403]
MFKKQRHTAEEYVQGILNHDRILLSKAITLVESKLSSDDKIAEFILEKILPFTGQSLRIGITGVPGAGKSTFIESFGKHLTSLGKKVAVLSIDPTSQRTNGSILGDKTRMEELANDPNAFIRPSASGNTLGGVHSKTRETMLLCEAAGFDIILIETVGVGQSETNVKGIVDFFLLLMLAGAGDELQGIKRGIMEMADTIIINKADGDNVKKCEIAKREYQNALHMFPPAANGWYPKVLTTSALNKSGLNEIWKVIGEFEIVTKESGHFYSNRQGQNLRWMHDVISYYLHYSFFNHGSVKEQINYVENQVKIGSVSAIKAAKSMIGLFM